MPTRQLYSYYLTRQTKASRPPPPRPGSSNGEEECTLSGLRSREVVQGRRHHAGHRGLVAVLRRKILPIPAAPCSQQAGCAALLLPWLYLPWRYLLRLGVPCSRSLWRCCYAGHLVVEQGEARGRLVALSRALGAREAGKGGERSRGHLAPGGG